MSIAIISMVQNQFNEDLSTQLLYSSAENAVLFFIIAIALFLIISTPVFLFFFSIDHYFKLKDLKNIISKDICCQNKKTHSSYEKKTCSGYVNNYSLFIGNTVGLIIWNVLSLVYIFSQNQSAFSGIISYLKFPFEILENYEFNNALSSFSIYKYNWMMMSGILLATIVGYYLATYITKNIVRNRVSKDVKSFSLT